MHFDFAVKQHINITFIKADGSKVEVKAPVGDSMLEVAHANNIDIEGMCVSTNRRFCVLNASQLQRRCRQVGSFASHIGSRTHSKLQRLHAGISLLYCACRCLRW